MAKYIENWDCMASWEVVVYDSLQKACRGRMRMYPLRGFHSGLYSGNSVLFVAEPNKSRLFS